MVTRWITYMRDARGSQSSLGIVSPAPRLSCDGRIRHPDRALVLEMERGRAADFTE
jgi:hypothetical protein